MRIVIDRISEHFATLEIGEDFVDLPLEILPEGAKEGDVLRFSIVDASELLAEARGRIERMQEASKSADLGETFDL